MANITGTNGNDTLKGTAGDDTILGLDGNDRIIGSTGFDTIDGGAGHDSIDFSKINKPIFLSLDASFLTDDASYKGPLAPPTATFNSVLSNIETVIGNPNQSNSLFEISRPGESIVRWGIDRIEVDLSKNQIVTYFNSPNTAPKIVTVKNFDNISVAFGKNKLTGNNHNNVINGGNGDDFVVGSKGNDIISGGGGNDTLDYSNLGRVLKVSLPTDPFSNAFGAPNRFQFDVNKNGFGQDKISGFNQIIGTENQNNTIDISASESDVKFDINLANNSMKLFSPDVFASGGGNVFVISPAKTIEFNVTNFVNVIGGKFNDKIVGGNKNSKLTGGGGNDTITGGNKNDIITGTDATARGIGEVDTLTGGGGRDKFVLGDQNGAYYVGKGKDDYALITDFNLFQDSISIGSLKNYSFALEGNNTIDLYSGKNVKTRDLIAKIQISGGISAVTSNAKSLLSADASLNAIVAKIDILSGNESERNS